MDDMMNYIPANRLFATISDRDITSKHFYRHREPM